MPRSVRVARIYDDVKGYRVLVDRLWPRGVSKTDALWQEWRKEWAPSNALRRRYHEGSLSFDEFAAAYRRELDQLDTPWSWGASEVILVTAAKNPNHSHASVLRDWLNARGA